MLALQFSDAALDAMNKLGLPMEEALMWWGSFPSLQRADDKFRIFTPERRAQLDVLSRRGCENPSDLTKRDRAFFCGMLIEAAAAIEAELGE